jgi:polysaccharide pyruvyl transferase WcaK-like protein
MIKKIVGLIDDIAKCVINDEDMDTLTHMKKVSECRIFIGHKTHSVIFALTVGTPIVALAYHVKTKDFLEQFGLDKNCISDNELTQELLIKTFDNVMDDLDNIGEIQYKQCGQFADKISQDIASIFSESY